jgi:serine/threonine-protein kinase
LKLAQLEAQNGQVKDARGHLNKILADSPENIWAKQRLAELEMYFGDPQKSVEIYSTLIKISPERSSTFPYLSNLGVAQVLLGRYDAAVEALSEALKIKPNDVSATLNLADSDLGLGHTGDAQALYGKILQQLEQDPPSGDTAYDLVKAQCLAHLGKTDEAKEIIQKALRRDPGNTDILLSTALVYILAGDPGSALETIKNALDKQVAPRWFKTPPYNPLFGDPKFQQLVDGREKRDR